MLAKLFDTLRQLTFAVQELIDLRKNHLEVGGILIGRGRAEQAPGFLVERQGFAPIQRNSRSQRL